jgi:hypothetical protein
MQGRWMYLVAIIDWYSRKIVGYELSQTMNKEFVIKAARCTGHCKKAWCQHQRREVLGEKT